nr:PREDICTED: coiled-coil domain-containing protein 77 [Lepisosteus oculatus]
MSRGPPSPRKPYGRLLRLQKALSDMQVYLFQEREQALRLYAENDRLKIRELEDRKKIQHLLALVGPDAGEITYFHKEPPHKVTISQKQTQPTGREPLKRTKTVTRRKSSRGDEAIESPESYKKDNQTLLLQVEALQAQMEEQTRLAKEQVESLLEDRRIRVEEAQLQHQRDQDRISALTDNDEPAGFTTVHPFGWTIKFHPVSAGGSGRVAELSGLSRQALEEQLKQAHRLADMYREQCVGLETELAQIREEGDVGREIFKVRLVPLLGKPRVRPCPDRAGDFFIATKEGGQTNVDMITPSLIHFP